MNILDSFIQGIGAIFGFGNNIISNLFFGAPLTFTSVLIAFTSSLPNGGTMPVEWHHAAQYFGDTLAKVSFILPTQTLMSCIAFLVTLKLGLWAFHLVKLVLNYIRGVPTSDFDGGMWSYDSGYMRRF